MTIPTHLREAFHTHMRNLIATAELNEKSAQVQFGEVLGWLGAEQRKLAEAAGQYWPEKVLEILRLEAMALSGAAANVAQFLPDKPDLHVVGGTDADPIPDESA